MKLFISYAHKDQELVKRLHYLLENVSKPRNDVFYDRNLIGSDTWWDEILGDQDGNRTSSTIEHL